MKAFQLCLCFIVLTLSSVIGETLSKESVAVGCEAPAVYASETAEVTCNFNVDVRSYLPVSISVEFYSNLGQNDSGVPILECVWIRPDDPGCKITAADHFKLQQVKVAWGMTLNILNVTVKDSGTYICKVMAEALKTHSDPCHLQVDEGMQAGLEGSATNPVVTPTRANLFNISESASGNGSSYESVVMGSTNTEMFSRLDVILPLALGACVLLAVVVITVVLLKRRARQRRSSHGLQKEGENNEDIEGSLSDEDRDHDDLPPEKPPPDYLSTSSPLLDNISTEKSENAQRSPRAIRESPAEGGSEESAPMISGSTTRNTSNAPAAAIAAAATAAAAAAADDDDDDDGDDDDGKRGTRNKKSAVFADQISSEAAAKHLRVKELIMKDGDSDRVHPFNSDDMKRELENSKRSSLFDDCTERKDG